MQRNLARAGVSLSLGGDEQNAMVGNAAAEATGTKAKPAKNDVSGRDVVVLGSGNLGLVYLMESDGRMTLEELEARHPQLLPAVRSHPHVGWVLVKSAKHGAVVLGGDGAYYLEEDRVEGENPLAAVSAHRSPASAAHARLRARSRPARRQLLRLRARRGLRLRRAHLLPRRPRRLADAPVRAPPGGPAVARRARGRCGGAPPRARRLEANARVER